MACMARDGKMFIHPTVPQRFLYGASAIAGQTEGPGRAPGNIVIARFTTYTNRDCPTRIHIQPE
jgi:hypothetical protein